MFNAFQFGNSIADKRLKAGFTQEQLIERVGEEHLSLSTLKRIESGTGHIDMYRIIQICDALNCQLQDLLGDNNLRDALEKYFCDPDKENEVDDRLYTQLLFYPKPMESIYYEKQPIKTLLQFIIYLPLMDSVQLLDALLRIEGDAPY